MLFLLFKNKGRNATGFNVCFVGERIRFAPLRSLLPDRTPFFTPDDLVDSLMCLLIACLVVTVGMVAVKYIWEKADLQFASIHPFHKKWYVVANMFKSFSLGCMCLSSRYWIGTYCAYWEGSGFATSSLNIKRCGMMYISTDVVALFMVPKLPFSTIMHHVVTSLLIIMVAGVDIDRDGYGGLLGVCKMAVLYGIFSTMAFLVNAYLALRVVYSKGGWLHILVKLSLWPYVLCCVCNWTVHLIWFIYLIATLEIGVINFLYILAISAMVNDDIVLIKWLMKRSSPGLREEEHLKKK